jgi:hypothetical protein
VKRVDAGMPQVLPVGIEAEEDARTAHPHALYAQMARQRRFIQRPD